jgi:hypothetical protein
VDLLFSFVMMSILSPAAETTCWITLIHQYHPNLSELISKTDGSSMELLSRRRDFY